MRVRVVPRELAATGKYERGGARRGGGPVTGWALIGPAAVISTPRQNAVTTR